MKNEILLSITCVMALLLLSINSLAFSNVEIYKEPVSTSICPCDTLTADHINAYIKNKGSSDTYKLSLDLPEKWSGFIKPKIELSVDEEKKIDPLWITPGCEVKPGVYTVKIKATSESTGKMFSTPLDINVLKCHYIEFSAPLEVNICKGRSKKIDLEIRNEGRFEERIRLSTNKAWAELSDKKVTIASKSSQTIPVILNPTQSGEVTITGESENSYAQASIKIQVNKENCYDFSTDLRPKKESICLKKSSKRTLTIENKGTREDNYTLRTSDWIDLKVDKVVLKPGKIGEIDFEITPKELGTREFFIEVSSVSSDKEQRLEGVVNTKECREVVVIATPTEREVCKGEKVEYEVVVKNSGNIEEVYNLESSIGTLNQNKVVLEPGEAKKLKLTVRTGALSPGEREIIIRASNEGISDTSKVKLNVENCYSAKLDISKEEYSVCQRDSVNFTIKVKNTGKFEDSYTLEYANKEKEFTLKPGETAEFNYQFTAMYKPGSKHEIPIKLHSKEIFLEKKVIINMKPSEECFLVDIRTQEGFPCCEVKAPRCKATVVPLEIENKGKRADTYSLSLIGPDWTYLDKNKTSLSKQEHETVYLYISPPYEAELDNYTIDIITKSSKTEDKLSLNIQVTPNKTEETTTTLKPTTTLPEETTTIEIPEENITVNKTEENVTPTGEVVKGEAGFWQRIIFFIILIVVIISLVYIFIS